MKFELSDQDMKLVEGKYVQLPLKRFLQLTEYVEDLENQMLAAEINLREAERVGEEMEQTATGEMPAQLPAAQMEEVTRVLQRLEPAELKRAMGEKKISVRKLATMTGIPYTTLHRYLRYGGIPLTAAKDIFFNLTKPKGLKQWGYAAQEDLKQR